MRQNRLVKRKVKNVIVPVDLVKPTETKLRNIGLSFSQIVNNLLLQWMTGDIAYKELNEVDVIAIINQN